MEDNNETNGRTHEPNLRELTAELDGVRELLIEKFIGLEKLMDERNSWYTKQDQDRQKAVEDALIAAKEQTAFSFAASKEAITKAEESQKAYNSGHNDLLRKMDDQHKETLPRPEAESKFKAFEVKDEDLRRDMLAQKEELRRDTLRSTEDIKREIAGLRESRAGTEATKIQVVESRNREQWTTGTIISVVFGVIATLGVLLEGIYLIVSKASGH